MKILHITYGYFPSNSWGGIATVVEDLAHAQEELGHEVVVCAANRLSRDEPYRNTGKLGYFSDEVNGTRCEFLDVSGSSGGSGTVGLTAPSLRSLGRLKTLVSAADVVHLHGGRNSLCLAGLGLAAWQRKRCILQPHGGLDIVGGRRRLKQLVDWPLRRVCRRFVGAAVALSESELRLLQDRFAIRDVRRFHNPVRSLPWLDRNVASGPPAVLFVGRLNWKKGPDVLLESMASLLRAGAATLRFVGPDDGSRAELEEMREALGVAEDRVAFAGAVGPVGLAEEYSRASLTVHPARVDTFPMAILESLASGCPTIVSSTVEALPLFEGYVEVCEPNAESVSRTIEAVLENWESHNARAFNNVRKVAERFDSVEIARGYLDLYSGAVKCTP